MSKNNKQTKGLLLIVMMSTLLVLSVGGYYIITGYLNQSSVKSVTNSSNEYYLLRSNATEYQKQIYEELTNALKKEPQDEQLIAQLIAKNYVADFYTWTNKVGTQDVGGVQFLNDEIRKPFRDKALETFYSDMNCYLKEGKIETTLEVQSSNTTVTTGHYDIDEETQGDAYVVSIQWQYQPSTSLDLFNYQNEAQVYVTKDSEGVYSIVEVSNEKNEQNTEA